MIAHLFLLTLVAPNQDPASQPPADAKRGLVTKTEHAAPGYTLIAPLSSGDTQLVDLDGHAVHTWKSDAPPGHSVFLMPNGDLMRAERIDNDTFFGGGQGGRFRRYTWSGELAWEYVLSDEHFCAHHDFAVLPNGHLLVIAWEAKSGEQAAAVGRANASDGFWPDCVLEIEPVLPKGGQVVWEWHAFDHLIQDRDAKLAGFGDVAAHPERIDVNANGADVPPGMERGEREKLRKIGYVGGGDDENGDGPPRRRGPDMRNDWLHTNAIDWRADLDLVVLSVHNLSEIWVIDHSTTTAEAATSKGGKYGKGGDLLLRYGNPQTHRAGTAADQKLSGQHDAQWIPNGRPGAGHVLVFNNGGRGKSGHSCVDEIVLPLDVETLKKPMDARALAALMPIWTYASDAIDSGHISGVQRLPNGDTLICAGETGRIVEVDAQSKVVWDFLNPFGGDLGPMGGRGPGGRRGPPPGMRDHGDGAPPAGRDGADERRRDGAGGPPDDGPRGRGMRGGPGMDRGSLFRVDRYAPDDPAVAKLALEHR